MMYIVDILDWIRTIFFNVSRDKSLQALRAESFIETSKSLNVRGSFKTRK